MESFRTRVDTEMPVQERLEGELPPEQEVSRFDMLLRNRRRLLLALLLLLIAVAVAVGSTATFTSETVNPQNEATTGTLTESNTVENGAILKAERMVPGQSIPGTVTITNTGTVKGNFSLLSSNLQDTPGSGGGKLSGVLELRVVDTGSGSIVYDGDFNSMPPQALGTWDPGEAHIYQFTVTFPDTGDQTAYQGSRTSIEFSWDATSG